jgi:hypothetical protein
MVLSFPRASSHHLLNMIVFPEPCLTLSPLRPCLLKCPALRREASRIPAGSSSARKLQPEAPSQHNKNTTPRHLLRLLDSPVSATLRKGRGCWLAKRGLPPGVGSRRRTTLSLGRGDASLGRRDVLARSTNPCPEQVPGPPFARLAIVAS